MIPEILRAPTLSVRSGLVDKQLNARKFYKSGLQISWLENAWEESERRKNQRTP